MFSVGGLSSEVLTTEQAVKMSVNRGSRTQRDVLDFMAAPFSLEISLWKAVLCSQITH